MWHRAYIESRQRGKALAYFYSTLAYAATYDLGVTHERFCPQLPWLLPWQPNASANGRILEMIAASICHEGPDCLYLLAGAPEHWLESGVALEEYMLLGGKVTVNVRRKGRRLTVETVITDPLPGALPGHVVYCLPEGWAPLQGGVSPMEGKAGWWRAKLEAANAAAFSLQDTAL